jgi:hypothetical protein
MPEVSIPGVLIDSGVAICPISSCLWRHSSRLRVPLGTGRLPFFFPFPYVCLCSGDVLHYYYYYYIL